MAEQQFKRHTAYKLRIGDVLVGKPVMNGEKLSFIELGNKKVNRVNVLGNIVEKYESEEREDGRKFLFLTLDDGSGQIKLKVFGDDSEKFKDVYQGQTVVVIGTLRYWNNETYVAPELIKENGGVELDRLITELREFSPGIINQEIQKLLEEGIIFEPRPGKIRYLG